MRGRWLCAPANKLAEAATAYADPQLLSYLTFERHNKPCMILQTRALFPLSQQYSRYLAQDSMFKSSAEAHPFPLYPSTYYLPSR